eukprot:g14330.t1
MSRGTFDAAARNCAKGYLYANLLRELLFSNEDSPYKYQAEFDFNEKAKESTVHAVSELQQNGAPKKPGVPDERKDYEATKANLWAKLYLLGRGLERHIKEKFVGTSHAVRSEKISGSPEELAEVNWGTPREIDLKTDFSWMCAAICDFLNGEGDERTECIAYSYNDKGTTPRGDVLRDTPHGLTHDCWLWGIQREDEIPVVVR